MCLVTVIGRSRPRPPTDLHRTNQSCRSGTFRRVHRHAGEEASGGDSYVGVGVARVRAVPPVRPGNPSDRVLNERHRITQRPDPSRCPGERPFPQRASRPQMYLAVRALNPTGKGRARWVMRWKPALNAFSIAFEGRNRLTCKHTNQTAVVPLIGHSRQLLRLRARSG